MDVWGGVRQKVGPAASLSRRGIRTRSAGVVNAGKERNHRGYKPAPWRENSETNANLPEGAAPNLRGYRHFCES